MHVLVLLFAPNLCIVPSASEVLLWVQTNVSWPLARRATMGYKGIQTSNYLPTSTIPVQTYMTPGCKDFNYM